MFNLYQTDRRKLLLGIGVGGLGLATTGCSVASNPPQKALADLSDQELFESYIKVLGTLETEDIYVWFKGVLWGALPGRLPEPFCGFQGLARHRWHAKAGGTYTQKAFDVGFFSDLETGEPIDTLVNPLTQETVEPYHNKYGGFEQVHNLEAFAKPNDDGMSERDTLDWRVAGNQLCMTERTGGQIATKLDPAAWPRESSGPTNYYAGETSYTTGLDQAMSAGIKKTDYNLFWSGFSPWEPWLLMDGAPGVCQWRATGMKLGSYKDAPKTVLDFVEKDQPNYFDAGDPWDGYLSATDSFKNDRKPASR